MGAFFTSMFDHLTNLYNLFLEFITFLFNYAWDIVLSLLPDEFQSGIVFGVDLRILQVLSDMFLYIFPIEAIILICIVMLDCIILIRLARWIKSFVPTVGD